MPSFQHQQQAQAHLHLMSSQQDPTLLHRAHHAAMAMQLATQCDGSTPIVGREGKEEAVAAVV